MPIYAYRCDACGFAKDVLQKVSDAPLNVCPSCDKPAFKKQLTAAGFQLKGTGWYVTDFRGGSGGTTNTAPSSNTSGASSSAAPASATSSAASNSATPSSATPSSAAGSTTAAS